MLVNSFTKAAPALFVLLWSSAFIGAKFGLPFAEPLTFIFLRFVFVAVIFLFLSLLFRANRPGTWMQFTHIPIVGLLMHAFYLNCTFIALDYGVPISLAALIYGLQPILTLFIVSFLLHSHISSTQWAGVFLGFLGLILVLYDKLGFDTTKLIPVLILVFGLFCITVGTIYQRKFCSAMNLLTGNFIQVFVGGVVTGIAAFYFESMIVTWNISFIVALIWMILIVSLGAHTLLLFMLQQNQVAKVSSLLYLTPPTASVMAYFMFDELLSVVAIAGVGVTVIGVALIMHGPTNKQAL